MRRAFGRAVRIKLRARRSGARPVQAPRLSQYRPCTAQGQRPRPGACISSPRSSRCFRHDIVRELADILTAVHGHVNPRKVGYRDLQDVAIQRLVYVGSQSLDTRQYELPFRFLYTRERRRKSCCRSVAHRRHSPVGDRICTARKEAGRCAMRTSSFEQAYFRAPTVSAACAVRSALGRVRLLLLPRLPGHLHQQYTLDGAGETRVAEARPLTDSSRPTFEIRECGEGTSSDLAHRAGFFGLGHRGSAFCAISSSSIASRSPCTPEREMSRNEMALGRTQGAHLRSALVPRRRGMPILAYQRL